jgi:predicted nucleotidyltransferase
MPTTASIQNFLNQITHWAWQQPDVQAVALVGSYARNAAGDDSDIDLVLLADEPAQYIENTGWVSQFGRVARLQIEDYGRLTSLRVWYLDGPEVEFGLTAPDWAAQPLDEGTDRVLMDGARVLFERKPLLSTLLEGFSQAEDLHTSLVQAIRQRANPEFAAQNRLWFKNDDFLSYGLRAA